VPKPSAGHGLSDSTHSVAERVKLGPVLRELLPFAFDDVRAAVLRTPRAARGLFVASILYLIALCALLLADRI